MKFEVDEDFEFNNLNYRIKEVNDDSFKAAQFVDGKFKRGRAKVFQKQDFIKPKEIKPRKSAEIINKHLEKFENLEDFDDPEDQSPTNSTDYLW